MRSRWHRMARHDRLLMKLGGAMTVLLFAAQSLARALGAS